MSNPTDRFKVNGAFQMDHSYAREKAEARAGSATGFDPTTGEYDFESKNALPIDKAEAILSVVNSVPLQYPSEDGSTETLIVKFEQANAYKDSDGNDIDVPLFSYDDIKYVSTEAIAVAAYWDEQYGDLDNDGSGPSNLDLWFGNPNDTGFRPAGLNHYMDTGNTFKNMATDFASWLMNSRNGAPAGMEFHFSPPGVSGQTVPIEFESRHRGGGGVDMVSVSSVMPGSGGESASDEEADNMTIQWTGPDMFADQSKDAMKLRPWRWIAPGAGVDWNSLEMINGLRLTKGKVRFGWWGVPGTGGSSNIRDPEWGQRYRWQAGTTMGTQRVYNFDGSTYTPGALGSGTFSGQQRLKEAGIHSMATMMPYSGHGPGEWGNADYIFSIGAYAHQLQEDWNFLNIRVQRINKLRRAMQDLWKTLEEEGGNANAEALQAEMDKLREMQEAQRRGEAVDAAAMEALEDNVGNDENLAAIAELFTGSGAEWASEFRAKEQCYLMTQLLPLAAANISRRVSYDTDAGGPKAYCVQGEPEQVVSALTFDPAYAAYYLLTPDKLSYLVPSVKFYSVLHQAYVEAEDGENRTTQDLAVPVDFEIPFFQHITDYGIQQILQGSAGGRGSEVGMKSFDWEYQGSNPATSRRDIKATLTMHAQNFDDIVRKNTVMLTDNSDDQNPREFEHEWAYADLAIRRNRDHLQKADSIYQQLKVVVGWSMPEANTEPIGFTPDEVRAIKNSRTTMFLTIIDHSFDIQEDGSIMFKIEYRAFIEGAFTSPEANILINENLLRREQERRAALDSMREDLSKGPDATCTEEDMAELRRRITSNIQLDKNDAHVSLIEGLEFGKPESRLFHYTVSAGEMIRYITNPMMVGATNAGQWELYLDSEDGNAPQENSSLVGDDARAPPGVAKALRQSINFPSTVNFNKESETVKEMMENVYSPPQSGEVKIAYFFLGDLVNVALENINNVDKIPPPVPEGSGGGGIPGLEQDDEGNDKKEDPVHIRQFAKMRILLGPMEITNPETQERMQINMADIPISVNYFMEWFLERITAKNEVKWFIVDFIKDVTRNLVLRVLGSDDCFGGAGRQKAKFQNLYLCGSTKEGKDPIGGLIASTEGDDESPTNQTNRLFVNEFMGPDPVNNPQIPILRHDTEDEEIPSDQMYHYVLCYAKDPTPRCLTGDFESDLTKGVFHFHIGTNKGIVKRIKFEKTDQPYMREARYFGQGYSGLSQLREPYKITIDMYGNSKVFPGQTIYVDPSGLGYGLGRPEMEGSMAWTLGLGGYHMIVNVQHSIERGKFETSAKANWVYRGAPEGECGNTELTAGSNDGTVTRNSSECVAMPQGGELGRASGYKPPNQEDDSPRVTGGDQTVPQGEG